MGCEEIRTHLADHLAGTLPPAVAEEVAAHLRSCPSCAAEADGLEETWQALDTLPAPRPDSRAMRARFDAMLAGYQEAMNPAAGHARTLWRPATAGRRSAIRYAAWMSAAAALLLVGVVLGRQTAMPPATDPQIASLREELRDMREMVTLSLLTQQSASERLRGVTYTEAIDQPSGEVTRMLLEALMHDPNDTVRLRAVEALTRLAHHEAVRRGAAQALARETAPLVQVALIDFVVETNAREGADALRRLSTDPMVNEQVRMRAADGLMKLGA